MTADPVRAAFASGAAHRRRRTVSGSAFALLASAFAGSTVIAAALAPIDGAATHLAEPPVPSGSWVLDWGPGLVRPSVEQVRQLTGLRAAAAGSASLVALLALLTLLGLWRQRLRLRHHEDQVHWAMGARRTQFAARVLGERWPWGAVGLGAFAVLTTVLPTALALGFPGPATIPRPLLPLLVAGAGLALILLRGESLAGERAAHPRPDPFRRMASSPVAVAGVGFAVLTGVSLLERHGPLGRNGPTPPDTWVTPVSLVSVAPDRPASERSAWLASLQAAGTGVGLASAGTARGAGHRARVWVDCGRCSEGGLPLPVRTVEAEVSAVAPNTFGHIGTVVVTGRDFDHREAAGSLSAAIVSLSFAARHFQGGQAVGRRLRFGEGDWIDVVGIVGDRADVRDHTEYAVYLPVGQVLPTEVEILASDGAAAASALVERPAGTGAGPTVPVSGLFAVHRWFAGVLTALGFLALGLVVLGAWLGARNEAQATLFEVSLRRAAGARRHHLVLEFMLQSAARLGGALGLGAWLSLFLSAGLDRAYGAIPPVDAGVWIRASVPVVAAYLVGSLPPFRAALRAPPALGLDASP